MVLNDFEVDVYALCKKEGIRKTEVAKELKMSNGNLSHAIQSRMIPTNFVRIIEAIGYDIKIEYVKKDN